MIQKSTIQSSLMKVIIDQKFPGVISYHLGEHMFLGNIRPKRQVKINGALEIPEIIFKQVNEHTAEYQMKFTESLGNLLLTVKLQVEDNQLWFDVTEIKNDTDYFLETIEFPEMDFVSVTSQTAGAEFSGARMSTNTHHSGDTHVNVTEAMKNSQEGYMYAFVSSDSLVATVWSNSHYSLGKSSYKESSNDHLRLTVSTYEANHEKVVSIASSPWHYQREFSGIRLAPTTLDLPSAKVIITGDLNGDQVVDWQDGAIAYRKIMNHPYGHEKVPELVAQRIVMNFGSQAQNPFLSTLDLIKKVYLQTDGLGQSLLLKGYGSEGHDSGHLDYQNIGQKLGGERDFKLLLKEAANFNAKLGLHINVTETYPESPYFVEEILKKNDDATYSYGWNWLDQAIDIDSGYDLAHGRNERFKDLKKIVADDLEYIYVDVWGNGQSGDESAWPSHQLAKQLNELGWRFAVEWSHAGEYDGTWHHWAVDLPYGGYQLKGINSAITRFIRHHQKDAWVGDMESYGGAANYPLLGGYSLLSFEGWQGQNNYDEYIQHLFAVNLPTKYLQHYQVTTWQTGEAVTLTDNDETYQWLPEMKIILEDDAGTRLVVEREASQPEAAAYRRRKVTEDQRLILTTDAYLLHWKWGADGYLLPASEQKLYYYSETGQPTKWELSTDWHDQTIYLYELTELGRQLVGERQVIDGQLSLNLQAITPFVIYLAPQEIVEMSWSTGAHLIDQGFNSGSLQHWDIKGPSDAARLKRNARGNTLLVIADNSEKISLNQKLKALKPNTRYVAYVGIENTHTVRASLSVTGGVNDVSSVSEQAIALNYVKAHPHSTDAKTATTKHQSYMQNLFVYFTTDDQPEKVRLTLAREAGKGQTFLYDIRVVENDSNMFDGQHDSLPWNVFTQDFENVAQGIYPFVVAGSEDVEDNRIHLSEFHGPYTQRGWNHKRISDVISGKWSLKINGLTGKENLVIQTIPQTITFEADQAYRVSFTYEAGWDDTYSLVMGDGQYQNDHNLQHFKLKNTWQDSDEAKRVSFEITGAKSGQSWIGIYSTEVTGKQAEGALTKGDVNFRSYNDFVLDDLLIEKI